MKILKTKRKPSLKVLQIAISISVQIKSQTTKKMIFKIYQQITLMIKKKTWVIKVDHSFHKAVSDRINPIKRCFSLNRFIHKKIHHLSFCHLLLDLTVLMKKRSITHHKPTKWEKITKNCLKFQADKLLGGPHLAEKWVRQVRVPGEEPL